MKNEVQDELNYFALIGEVALVDKEAAAYMHGPMREIEGFEPTGDLWGVVIWQHTKQGTDYWHDIAQKIGQ
jgi:hypothetical protein